MRTAQASTGRPTRRRRWRRSRRSRSASLLASDSRALPSPAPRSQRPGSEEEGGAGPAGIALATAVMYLRVLLLIGVLATRVFIPFAIMILPALIIAWGAGYWLYRKAPRSDAPTPPGNPIALLPALGFVIFVAAAAVAGAWAQGRFGQSGIAVLLLIMGSMDVDVAIVTLGNLSPDAIAPLLA